MKTYFRNVLAFLIVIAMQVYSQNYDYTPNGWVYGYSSPHNIEVRIVNFSSNSKRTKFEVKKHDNTSFGQSVTINIRKDSDNGTSITTFTISSGSYSDNSDYYYYYGDFSTQTNQVSYYATMTVGGFTHKAGPVKIFILRLENPELVSPLNGATNLLNPISFNWNNVTFATTYRIQIGNSLDGWSTETGFSPTSLVHEDVSNSSNYPWSNAQSASTYYWSVRAGSNYHPHSEYTSPRSFTTALVRLQPPVLNLPISGVTNVTNPTYFDWSNVTNATGYRIQVGTSLEGWSEESGFSTNNLTMEAPVAGSDFQWDGGTQGILYYWSVRAGSNSIYHSVYPSPWNFKIRLVTPTLISPSNGSSNLSSPTNFDWEDVSSASNYRIQIGTSLSGWSSENGFSQDYLTHEQQVTSSNYQWTGGTPGTQYYWSVRAGSNNIFNSLYTDTWNFTFNHNNIFGSQVGEFNGVIAYSNGNSGYISNEYNYVNTTNTGMKWQCVEYCNRYYALKYNQNIRVTGHNAEDYFPNASQHGLIAFNNNSIYKPIIGDIICSGGGEYGHIGVIREVGTNSIKIIHQNWSNTSNDNSHSIQFSFNNGVYSIGDIANGYAVAGFLRSPNAMLPTPNLLSPLSNATLTISPILFDWDDVQNATNYRVQIGNSLEGWTPDAGFLTSHLVYEEPTTLTSLSWPSAENQKNYFWTVRAGSNSIPHSHYSAPRMFTTAFITDQKDKIQPAEYIFSQNYPNPFNPVTTIQYGLPFTNEVNIAVYDMVGQKIATLVNREQNAGYYEETFEIDGLSSGIYFYVITAKQTEGEKTFRKVMKMILMK